MAAASATCSRGFHPFSLKQTHTKQSTYHGSNLFISQILFFVHFQSAGSGRPSLYLFPTLFSFMICFLFASRLLEDAFSPPLIQDFDI